MTAMTWILLSDVGDGMVLLMQLLLVAEEEALLVVDSGEKHFALADGRFARKLVADADNERRYCCCSRCHCCCLVGKA